MIILETKSLTKSFGGVHALKDISLSFEEAEIHGICGENGAGKSTLIKILSGVYPAGSFEGEIFWRGEKVFFRNIREAERCGIAVIHQELALVNNLSIAENIFLGSEPQSAGMIDEHRMNSETASLLNQLGLQRNPYTPVAELGIGEQQLIEIAKALRKQARFLILDEPTTALTETEITRLLNILRELKRQGVTLLYISHKLSEVLSLCDRVSVMKDGRFNGTKSANELNEKTLVQLMVGREISDFYPHEKQPRGERVMAVKNLTLFSEENSSAKKVDDVSLEIYAGEILGIAGLMGSGRTELLMGIAGAWKGGVGQQTTIDRPWNASVKQEKIFSSPADALAGGVAMVTEDRKQLGLDMDASINFNLNLASLKNISSAGMIQEEKELLQIREVVESLGIKISDHENAVNSLSGGNQQKVVLGKFLLTHPRILLLDEPTRGIDVGAKQEIYLLMNALIRKGMAIVMVSSELPEVLGMSHRILVMNRGRIAAEFLRSEASEEKVMEAATKNF